MRTLHEPGQPLPFPNPDRPWTPTAGQIRDAVNSEVPGWAGNGLIANRYRDGDDSISWHADDEPALGEAPVVASVSLGSDRIFRFRPTGGGKTVLKLELGNGDLVVMGGRVQHEFQHAILKTPLAVVPRLSLTFRRYGRAH